MECALSTFSLKEVEDLLHEEGIAVGTPEFRAAMCRRFRPSEDVPGEYVEREDWEGKTDDSLSSVDRHDSQSRIRSRSERVGNLPGQNASTLFGRGYKIFV
ncbi:MAG: hypothetical protein WDZ68_01020 [Candidatus Paceibacterota bacterium]